MKFMRFIHKWIGILLGIQLTLWMLSGFMMSFYDKEVVEGHHLMKHTTPQPISMEPIQNLDEVLAQIPASDNVINVSTDFFRGQSIIKVVTHNGTYMYDATNSEYVEIDETLARQIAIDDFAGNGTVVNIEKIMAPTMETRESNGPGWRVDFDNDENSSLYISAETGQIWERRHDLWREFDIYWMLHIMDYENRKSFNGWLVIFSAWIALWIGLSGMIILIENFRKGDFNLIRKWRAKKQQLSFAVVGGDTLTVMGGKSLFDALEENHIKLPTSCGGGGSCGLCLVKLEPAPEPLAADRREISAIELEQGYRLSCQHSDYDSAVIHLPDELLNAQVLELEVVSTNFVTPTICEIEFKNKGKSKIEFFPGCYFEFTIPAFERKLENLQLIVNNAQQITRTYSVANAEHELSGNLKFNVRLILDQGGDAETKAGLGSSYMTTLSVGDQINVRGPFGDFKLKPNTREKIFIGGGAGMAPLRSMIMHQFFVAKDRSKISFWYGARTIKGIYYQDEFNDLVKSHDNFSWQYALSEQDQSFIHEMVYEDYLRKHPDLSSCDFYLCGPPAMLEATKKMLKSLDVSDDQIALDDFGV